MYDLKNPHVHQYYAPVNVKSQEGGGGGVEGEEATLGDLTVFAFPWVRNG